MSFFDHSCYDIKFDPMLSVSKASNVIDVRVPMDTETNWQRFLASPFTLSEKSDVLQSMMQMDCKETNERIIEISDFPPRTVYQFLNFLNGRKLSVLSTEETISLVKIAEKYFVEDLKQKCQDILLKRIELHNVLEIYESIRLHAVPTLKNYCEQFIAAYFPAISSHDDFLYLNEDTVKSIISLDVLNVGSEMDVYDAVCRWSRQRCCEKDLCICKKHLVQEGKELFRLVRFGNMTDHERDKTFCSLLNVAGKITDVEKRRRLNSDVLHRLAEKVQVIPTGLPLTITTTQRYVYPATTFTCLKFMAKKSSTYLVGFRGAFYQTSTSVAKTVNMRLYQDDTEINCSPTSLYLPPEKDDVSFVDRCLYVLDRPLKLHRSSMYTVEATFDLSHAGDTRATIPCIKTQYNLSMMHNEHFKIYGNINHIFEICYIGVAMFVDSAQEIQGGDEDDNEGYWPRWLRIVSV